MPIWSTAINDKGYTGSVKYTYLPYFPISSQESGSDSLESWGDLHDSGGDLLKYGGDSLECGSDLIKSGGDSLEFCGELLESGVDSLKSHGL